ncbi:mycofactocin biosynthesis peptidyl-dipeptidase MftE [Nocardioides sp. BP30]|uniref:mycofactocin biosynthesis peptidyl-dipeptidase MftE n=1 Tax=Nocardioides sp. BP30 TaxID=3036374 RepID=UPI0024688B4F|nr:mycofactocin biosynthesis peptidyl-dipeptidase MftE [Nocardioides sp. BP30]WGL54123.1 mycofactocin biosynthesis peptidyl-dipeptidase MftE [Nocardioides sp. BP30]
MTTSRLAQTTWEDARGRGVLLVPVGSLEQHGPHLPLDTDTCIAQAVADGLAARLGDAGVQVWVGPPLGYGSSGEHQSFAGTVSIGTHVLHDVVVELVRSARTWTERVVLVNAHGGNAQALTRAVKKLRTEGHDVAWLPCRTEGVDLHAGRTETSLMLHLRPSSVRRDRAVAGDTRPLTEILPAMIAGGVAAVSENGVLGDPAGAHADEGAALLADMVEELAVAVLHDDGVTV